MEVLHKKVENYLIELGIQNVNNFKAELDSISFIHMIVQFEQEYEISIDDEYLLIENFSSIDMICDYIIIKCNEKENK